MMRFKRRLQRFLSGSKRAEGVTLFELIIAITISGFVLTGVMASYVSLSRSAQKIDISRQLQREINFAMARISDRVRGFSTDYDTCNNYADNLHKLCVQGGDYFEFDDENGMLNMNGQPLFSPVFEVKEVAFNVTPTEKPSGLDPQPRVQVYLRVGLGEGVKIHLQDFEIQTTLSSRLYQ